jgi:hypothetical protein
MYSAHWRVERSRRGSGFVHYAGGGGNALFGIESTLRVVCGSVTLHTDSVSLGYLLRDGEKFQHRSQENSAARSCESLHPKVQQELFVLEE